MAFLAKSSAMLRQRCPRCLNGPIYRGWIDMHERCPVCELVFEREPGYFVGALYISYGMATIVMGLFMLFLHLLLPAWDLGWVALLAIASFIPLAPMVSRYARVIWMYFDRWAWPEEASKSP